MNEIDNTQAEKNEFKNWKLKDLDELTVHADRGLQIQAKKVLDQLDIPLDTAINIFLHAVVIYQGIPFKVTTIPET